MNVSLTPAKKKHHFDKGHVWSKGWVGLISFQSSSFNNSELMEKIQESTLVLYKTKKQEAHL